ncbi:DNA mismatch repair protein MutS [uncultured Tateyamaria sp.]|uniref:DNA mismatch repair protein MutS n=1 Tax=uncultured Tateyamaria sp. TaxID=455651 RepID=UPI00261348FA|nr:DNA mismatch repair protein MutS [uncultured Tateyamaria sp.]
MSVTPMMAQYLEIKSAHEGALLFYRMGDFYEMFFEDAVAAAEALDIALTKRGKHDGADIPMCGVPVHAAEGYLLTLIRKGFRVAVCEQMESPAEAKKRGYKSVVKRDVVRLVTPGTLTEDSLLEARRHNFLAAFADVRGDCALAWVDISTGAFHVMPLVLAQLGPELARLAPSELIIADSKEAELRDTVEEFGIALTALGNAAFDSAAGADRVCNLFGVGTLDAYGTFIRAEAGAMGALVEYLEVTQKGNLPLLQPPQQETQTKTVQIDAATRRNLELTTALSGGRAGSLLSIIDETVTSGGARLLERRLSSPSRVLETISARSDAVSYYVERGNVAQAQRQVLRSVPDMDRALSRLSLDRGGPRDLAALRNGLTAAQNLKDTAAADLPDLLNTSTKNLGGHTDLIDRLDADLVAEPPLLARDGGFIATGCDPDLDEARQLRDEGRSVIAQLQRQYVETSGINALKIKHNNVLGYFVEVTATHAEKMLSDPLSQTFIHRQTTANQVRFTTVELSDLETRILNAGARALEIEMRLYEALKSLVVSKAAEISQTANALAELDLATSLAHLAVDREWCKPTLDTSRAFDIEGGRHPVVENALKAQGGTPFIANDCLLTAEDGAAIWLLTGPNMAGKSTFLRQNALIAILAQIGSHVPATAAHIGIVSQIFSRVGASDDLARGRSTFMVEMVETAAILNQADDRALVILDEIGRGTATYDGLSIAWATLEHLHDVNKSRALFATHYHEMTALAGKLDGVDNATVAVKEWEGEVVFLHEVRRGAADRSYGVQVAQLAGLPPAVIARARVVLDALETGEREGGASQKTLIDDLPLFSAVAAPPPTKPADSPALDMLKDIHPDDLSPKDALDLIYKLKDAARS